MASRRQRQIAELLHEEISLLIQRRTRDPRVAGVTVTGVEVSADLKNAYVYVSVLGSEEDAQEALVGLRRAAGFLRRELGASLSLRITPELIFRLDNSIKHGARIDQLLNVINEESDPDGEDLG